MADSFLMPLLEKHHRWKLVIFPLHCILRQRAIKVNKLKTIKPFIYILLLRYVLPEYQRFSRGFQLSEDSGNFSGNDEA